MVCKIAGTTLLLCLGLGASQKAIRNTLECSPILFEQISRASPHLPPIHPPHSYCDSFPPNWILLSVAFAAIALAYRAAGSRR